MKGDIVELWQDSHSESTPELCSRIWLGSSSDVAEVNLDDAHSQEEAISLIGMIPWILLDRVEKGQKCMAIIDLNQIWFIDNKFGVTIRLQQTLLEQSAKLPSFAFKGVDLPEDDVEVDADEDEIEEVDDQ